MAFIVQPPDVKIQCWLVDEPSVKKNKINVKKGMRMMRIPFVVLHIRWTIEKGRVLTTESTTYVQLVCFANLGATTFVL